MTEGAAVATLVQTYFTHVPGVSGERFLLVVFAGSEGTCICVCIHISKLTFKHCLAFTSFLIFIYLFGCVRSSLRCVDFSLVVA